MTTASAAAVPRAQASEARATADALRAEPAAWDAFVRALPLGTFRQMTAWAEANAGWGWVPVRVVADSPDGPVGAQLLMHRMRPGPWSRGYATRAPLAHHYTEASIGAFTAAIRGQAERERLTHVLADPEFPRGGAEGKLMLAAGWRPGTRVQPSQTRVVDLTLSQERLWSGLSSTARWSVNKARRLGITACEVGAGGLSAFGELYRETALRVGFRRLDRFEEVFRAFDARRAASIVLARDAAGRPMGAVMLLAGGERIFELYSASTRSGEGSSVANYLVIWEAIVRSRERGFAGYDLWGTNEPNLARFKAHFGGEERLFDGPYELVTDRPGRMVLSTVQRLRSVTSRGREAADSDQQTA